MRARKTTINQQNTSPLSSSQNSRSESDHDDDNDGVVLMVSSPKKTRLDETTSSDGDVSGCNNSASTSIALSDTEIIPQYDITGNFDDDHDDPIVNIDGKRFRRTAKKIAGNFMLRNNVLQNDDSTAAIKPPAAKRTRDTSSDDDDSWDNSVRLQNQLDDFHQTTSTNKTASPFMPRRCRRNPVKYTDDDYIAAIDENDEYMEGADIKDSFFKEEMTIVDFLTDLRINPDTGLPTKRFTCHGNSAGKV